jgi:hypothetical protein
MKNRYILMVFPRLTIKLALMRKVLLAAGCFIMSLIYTNVNAQVQLDWARRFYGLGLQYSINMARDNSGNVWVTGTTGNSPTDVFLVKYNSAGTQTAGVIYGSPYGQTDRPGDVATDASGNVYIAGKANVNSSTADIFLVKYNTNGGQIWSQIFSTPGLALSIDDVEEIAVDASGNVYLGGHVVKNVGFEYDYLTIKYNSAGVLQWYQLYNGSANGIDMITDIAVDASGNVIVTGRSEGTTIVKGRTVPTRYDFATIKYNSAGVQQWVARYAGTITNANEFGEALALDASGNVYVTGTTNAIGSNNSNCATVKYNSSGVQQWAQTFAGGFGLNDYATDVAVDGSGNAYVCGIISNSGGNQDVLAIKYTSAGAQAWWTQYDAGTGNYESGIKGALDGSANFYVAGSTSIPGVTNSDLLTIKFTTNGTRAWVVRYNSATNWSESANDLLVVSSSSPVFSNPVVYVAGTTSPGTDGDAITVKYSQPIIIGRSSEIEPLPGEYVVRNAPNPFHSATNIEYTLPEAGRVSISVYDVMGRKVATLVDAQRAAGVHVQRFTAGNLSDGVYHYQFTVKSNGKEFLQTNSVVLQR